jgi:hypothetical protein
MQEVGGSIPPGSTSLRRLRLLRLGKPSRSERCRVGDYFSVIASQRIRASRRPMTGCAKAIQSVPGGKLDGFVAEFIIGPAEGGTRWLLAMTV